MQSVSNRFFLASIRSLIVIVYIVLSSKSFAEGSRELNSSSNPFARRVFLSQGIGQVSGLNWYKITTLDSIEARNNFYVYVNAGDSIALASSALGVASGSITLIRPDGTVAGFYTTAPGDTGFIRPNGGSRNRELQGPFGLYGGGTGYVPRVFVADQPGIWIVRFLPPNGNSGASNYTSPLPPLANADFAQPNNNTVISAFDISVIKDGAIVRGRVYANYLVLTGGALSQGSNPKRYASQYFDLFVLTREGYRYEVAMHGLSPYGYFIYTDNVGLQLSDGVSPAYESIRYQGAFLPANRRIFKPDVDAETIYETSHKIFFNAPDATMPATATLQNSTVWLYAVLVPSTYNTTVNFNHTGIPNPIAGDFSFSLPNQGVRYKIAIDLNNNNVFGDSSDVDLFGSTIAGANSINWNGLDRFGNPANYGCFGVRIEFVAGELHIPLADAENFRGGIQVKRINGNGTLPDYKIHWNDLTLNDNTETPLGSYLKRTPVPGISSEFVLPIDTSIRRWEFQESGTTENYTGNPTHTIQYGDQRFMDQWAFDTLSSNTFSPIACLFVLPVSITDFKVRPLQQHAYLSWNADMHSLSAALFAVERRAINDLYFETLEHISVANRVRQFSYTDKSIEPNRSYVYRIKWLLPDGKIKYSDQQFFRSAETTQVNIYPNPADQVITVNTTTGNNMIRLLKADGKVVKTIMNAAPYITIPVKDMKAGIYFIEITDGAANTKIHKIVIQH